MNPVPGANVEVDKKNSAPVSPWVKLAQDAFRRSTTYFDNNIRKRMESDLRMFQSKHPPDSKYNSEEYKFRSKIFRPKSRSVLRKNEATAALAFFSNPDVMNVDPGNPEDQGQVMSSSLVRELMQYRLTKTIPWFLTVLGAFQDSMNVGLACSLQHWRYREVMEKQTVTGMDPVTGAEISAVVEVPRPIEDSPFIDLFPVENVRFDPAAQWYNVAKTSPYLILQMPMYVNDVLDRMKTMDRLGRSWKTYDTATLRQCKVDTDDSLRMARDGNQESKYQAESDANEFDVIMVHLNFIRKGHDIHCYYTLGDKHLLSDPLLLREMFPHCKEDEPPVVIGFCVLEAHRTHPTSVIGLGGELQRESNEIVNSRLDNVKFVLNKRTLFRRGANVDIAGWMRNVPGAGILVNDVEKDAKPIEYQDVTSSSYQEQDRVNVDYDELLGNFAQGSVLTNRKLNETVGGMRMMAQGANMLTEYTIRTFVETWAEPVLQQVARMEQTYETDEVILGIAGARAQLLQKFGIQPDLDSLLNQEVTLTVNIGMGATDPDTRFQRLMQAFGAYAKMVMEGPPDINLPEFRKEVFGLAGFKDASRFFTDVDPRLEQAKKMLEGAKAQAEEVLAAAKDRLASRERSLDVREMGLDVKEMELTKGFEVELQRVQNEFILAEREAQVQWALDSQKARQSMGLERDKAEFKKQLEEQKAASDARLKTFSAKVDAAVKMFLAQVQAKAATKAKPKGDGE